MVEQLTERFQTPALENTPTPEPNDRELLLLFRAGDQAAFAMLVQRHASLVQGVCQRLLRQVGEADDAFQATFLVLARKARSIDWTDSIAGWLHQTARRTALKLRATTARRREVESQAARQHPIVTSAQVANPASRVAVRELGELLDTELSALPARFREVILLSQVQGLPRDEVAERLGITLEMVKDRLERGRERLRARLLRRGIALSAATLAAWLAPATAEAAGVVTLATSTSHAAGAFATGGLAAEVSPTAASLAQGVLKMMSFEKLKYVTAWFVSLLTASGVAYGVLKDEPTRFQAGLRGQVVAVAQGQRATVTIALEELGAKLNLDVSAQVQVWTAFEQGQFGDLKPGQFVSLRLGDDHRTVNTIHIQGSLREAAIHSIAPSGKLMIIEGDDDDEQRRPREVELAPDAILRLGGLPAARQDLKPGMHVPLEFGRDGKLVHAIEAEAAKHTLTNGRLLELDLKGNSLLLGRDENDDGLPIQQLYMFNADTIVILDGKPAKLADLMPGAPLTLRLADDGQSIRALKAGSPDKDDN